MRKKKAFLNMSMSLVYQIVAVICGLITPRLLLSTFGSTYNGIVASATQFLNMINLLTLGITASTRVALYKTLAADDVLGTSRLIKATKIYMHKVGWAIIIYAAVLCIIYPFVSHNDLAPLQNASLIAIVSIGTFADYFFGLTNITLLQADQASYITNTVNIFKIIANTVCVAILIYAGCSIYLVKLGSSLVFFIAPAVLSYYIKKKYHLVNNCEPDYTGIKQRGAVAFHSISNIIHDNTDLVVLTLFTDAKLISVYTVFYLVIGKIKTLMLVFTSGMEAAFGDMWVKKEIDSLQRNFRLFEYMLFSFAAVIFSCVGVLILPFISIYTRNVTDINYLRLDLAILITLAEGMYCIRQPYLTLVYSTGSFEETKRGAAVEALINVVLSFSLVYFIGIGGVIIGTLVANIFRTTQFALFISKKILKRSVFDVIKRFIWLIVTSTVICITSVLLQNKFTFAVTWSGWLFEAVIVFVFAVFVTLVMSLVFYRSDLKGLLAIAKKILIRRRKKS